MKGFCGLQYELIGHHIQEQKDETQKDVSIFLCFFCYEPMAKPGRLPDFRKMYPEASEEVIEVLKETERKMQYQEYDLKAEQTIIDQDAQEIRVIPSREDSYERLLEEHNLPADEQADVENIVLRKILRKQLHEAIRNLEEGEQYLIIQLFFMDRSERELAEELGLSQKAVNKRRHKILEKF